MNRIKIWRGFIVVLLFIAAAHSCTKIKSTEIGSELIPAVDNITTFDTTLEVITENFIVPDSLMPRLAPSVTGLAPEMVVGHIANDPQFGKSTGSLSFYFPAPFYPFSYEVKDSIRLDSVVLGIRWTGITQGDTNAIQKFNVYQLQNVMRSDSAYGVTNELPFTRLLGTRTFTPSILNDSIFPIAQRLTNQLRIRLSDAFGNELLRLDSSAGQPFSRDSLFRAYLKGLTVVPDVAGATSANALMGFNLSDTNTYLRIYYRYDTASVRDTAVFKTFRYSLVSGFANTIKREYNGSQAGQALAPGADSTAFVQTSPGTYVRLRMPSLSGFRALKGNVVIHRAELKTQQVAEVGQGNDLFATPNNLYLEYQDSATGRLRPFLLDGFVQNAFLPAVLGGVRRVIPGPGGISISEYRFNIPRYVQDFVTRNAPNHALFLSAPYAIRYVDLFLFEFLNPIARGRVKLAGGSSASSQKMTLRIIYSKI